MSYLETLNLEQVRERVQGEVGGIQAWVRPAAAPVGRIPYLAWNWELANWMENVGRKLK